MPASVAAVRRGTRIGTVQTGCAPLQPHAQTILHKVAAAADEKYIIRESVAKEEN